jgi:hypothetical protein
MVPNMSSRERLIKGLNASMDALQTADGLNDEDAAWSEIQNVLGCLQRLEEQAKSTADLAYYRHRGNSTGGQIVGGLIWVRGLVVHHDAEVRIRLFRPFAIAGEDNAPQPLAYKSIPGSDPIFVDDVVWPERRHLPAPGRRYKSHQRDAYYDTVVAGEPLMGPLRAARSYFVDER